MAERKTLEALGGDELRIMCPDCQTTWTTLSLPSECPTCGAEVMLRIVRRSHQNREQTKR